MPRIRASAILILFCACLLGACATSAPEGVHPVTPFVLDRYLGKWVEIARLDHSFERGLSDVTATYALNDDGSVRVLNRGFDTERQVWKEAVGRAVFTGEPDTGSLKVSFFGPFYGGYHVIALDQENYGWSLVAGPRRDYLWILAREKTLPGDVRARLLAQAQALGFATDALIWVDHGRTAPD